jgi:hypothetical protein
MILYIKKGELDQLKSNNYTFERLRNVCREMGLEPINKNKQFRGSTKKAIF